MAKFWWSIIREINGLLLKYGRFSWPIDGWIRVIPLSTVNSIRLMVILAPRGGGGGEPQKKVQESLLPLFSFRIV